MQVVCTNANNEMEMVYVDILGAVIIANLLEIATTNTFNILRHAISQWIRGFPSKLKVKMFSNSTARMCTDPKIKQTCLFFCKKKA